jgi:putative salt-induced outer membrane protein
MQHLQHKLLIIAFGASMSHIALANEAQESMGLKGHAEAGYNASTGNTDTSKVLAKVNLDYITQDAEYVAKFEVSNNEENNSTIEERYMAELQYNLFFDPSHAPYIFTNLRYESNKFSNIDLDSTYSAGVGNKLYQTKEMLLKGEAGLGYQKTEFEEGADETQTVVIGKIDFNYQINPFVSFAQDALVNIGVDSNKLETNTSLKTSVTDTLKVSMNYKVKYNSDPGVDVETTDTETSITLIYDF